MQIKNNFPFFITFLLANLVKKAHPIRMSFFWWAIRDSNPGPTGYEPVALTN